MTSLVMLTGNILYNFNVGSLTKIDNISVLVIEAVKWTKVQQYDLKENVWL